MCPSQSASYMCPGQSARYMRPGQSAATYVLVSLLVWSAATYIFASPHYMCPGQSALVSLLVCSLHIPGQSACYMCPAYSAHCTCPG